MMTSRRLLVKARSEVAREAGAGMALQLGSSRYAAERLFPWRGAPSALGAAAEPEWFVVSAPEAAHPWDAAHRHFGDGALAAAAEAAYVEPDFEQEWFYTRSHPEQAAALAAESLCKFHEQDSDVPVGPSFAWHLDDGFSQLRQARDAAGDPGAARRVRIGILDTGYDPAQRTRPENLRNDLERNFVEGGNSAADPGNTGLLKNPGHGTGTLAILAGNRLIDMDPQVPSTGDYLGGAPHAEILPVRIANSVVLFSNSSFARGLDYVLSNTCHVVSISMGGVASKAWTEVVNRAYELGVVIVAAAGNSYGGLPTHHIVYPARYRRVIAACGVMANGDSYTGLPISILEGNWGPDRIMDTAVAAYTPNVPWAKWHCEGLLDLDGRGTSSATPQIAAAAALYIQRHWDDLARYTDSWKRAEAVRLALFCSAYRNGVDRGKVGQGLLRANDALRVAPGVNMAKQPDDSATFAFLRILTGLGVAPPARLEMYGVEAAQLLQRDAKLQEIIPDPDLPGELIPRTAVRDFMAAVIEHPDSSEALRNFFRAQLGSGLVPPPAPIDPRSVPDPVPPKTEPETTKPEPVSTGGPKVSDLSIPAPQFRCLRGYAFDPSLSARLETAGFNRTIFRPPWEDLQPGPVGEYVEIIDYDPASQCFYAPVDLNHPHLLAGDGLDPSEGNPKFHQQMVYAVAMTTIANFERALGRFVLWSSPSNDDSRYIQRLRVYPHAFRDENAYYSPLKKSLLFGYFPAVNVPNGRNYPGGMVFTCLSHDIVAHEMTHAILDGMHRRFQEPSNPDVLAFHEAFADISALLQHFSMTAALRQQIGKTRGDLRTQSLLGELAMEFGVATGKYGALRSAIGRYNETTQKWEVLAADPTALQRTVEVHERGAILVAAVFDALVSIYSERTADLRRIATNGTGVLPEGDIHPDLVDRLTDEASQTALDVLQMCIRALDYCPPVDLTFGDYLRALITADFDFHPDDPHHRRVAFVEAFRRRGIYPNDVRTLSVDSLRWQSASDLGTAEALKALTPLLIEFAHALLYEKNRQNVFFTARRYRARLHETLKPLLANREDCGVCEALGLDPAVPAFEVHALRLAQRMGGDGRFAPQVIVEITQQRGEILSSAGPAASFPFRGGCTLIVDLKTGLPSYNVIKSMLSSTRLGRQRAFMTTGQPSLRATYFASTRFGNPIDEPFRLLHR